VDKKIFDALYIWARRRHPNKSSRWLVRKYFIKGKHGLWNFYGKINVGEQKLDVSLVHVARIPIRRHIKIRSEATPYDPQFDEYFTRRGEKGGKTRNHWFDTPEAAL